MYDVTPGIYFIVENDVIDMCSVKDIEINVKQFIE